MNLIEKTIKILNYLSEVKRSVGITELSSKLSFPKSTVHRVLSNLLRYNLVSQEKETSKYKLGLQILEYSNSFYKSFDFWQISKPIVKKICTETKLTTFLTAWCDGYGVCIDSVTPFQKEDTYHLFIEIGQILPFHCTASAKLLLAYQSPEEIKKIINEKPLIKYTTKTIVNPKKLEEHLSKTRENGFSICDEELMEGVRAIAVPIRNINRKVVASITIMGLSKKIPNNNIKKLIKILVNSTQELSKMLG